MKKIILLSLVCAGFLLTVPLTANALDGQEVGLNLDSHSERLLLGQTLRYRQREQNVLPTQARPSYQIGYTVHYRTSRNSKWTLEGFHAERRDAELAARRLQRSGFRTQIRSRAAAERRGLDR